MKSTPNFASRVRDRREQLQLSQAELAKRVGISQVAIKKIESGGKTRHGRLLAQALGVTLDYLEIGQARPESGAALIDLDASPDTIRVRKVMFKISAGIAGFAVDYLDNGEGTPLYLPKTWADKKHLSPEKLYATRVSGSSMYPTILPSDVVIVNTADTKRAKDAVCAINHEGEFTVKRLKYEYRRWWLMSDNPDKGTYPPTECTEGTYILGRVVHLHRDL